MLSADGREFSCVARNISQGGAKVKGEDFGPLKLGDEISLRFGSIGPILGTIRYKLPNTIGINFGDSIATMKMLTELLE